MNANIKITLQMIECYISIDKALNKKTNVRNLKPEWEKRPFTVQYEL